MGVVDHVITDGHDVAMASVRIAHDPERFGPGVLVIVEITTEGRLEGYVVRVHVSNESE
jgi:hypothetical protein